MVSTLGDSVVFVGAGKFKGQMNQNLNIFSLAILKRRNVKQNI